MKRLLASFILIASPALAQIGPVPAGGAGAIGSGTALTACTSSILYADASSLLKCNPASVVNGSVSTAGRSILTIKDTITGGSSTSNFLNITGTFNGTLSAETSGLLVSVTGDNDLQRQSSIKGIMAAAANTSSLQSAAIYGDTSGAVPSFGGLFTNSSSDSFGVGGFNSGGGTAGVGGFLGATGATYRIFGVIGSGGNASAVPAESTGVLGIADSDSGTGVAGVWARINSATLGVGSTMPTLSLRGALVADNTTAAENIFVAADNGTAVFTIADGGAITATGNVNFAGSTSFISGTIDSIFDMGGGGSIGGLAYRTSNTPDIMLLYTGSTPNSIHIAEYVDRTFDFQNPCTTGLGTAACTDPTFIVHSHNQDTGEFLSMAHDGKAGVIVGGNSTVLDGLIRLGGTVTLTESSATTVLTIPIPVSTGSGGFINYVVDARDATNVQVRTGNVSFAVANTSGGTETCNVFGVGPTTQAAGGNTTNPANPTEVQDGSGTGAITSGTLTYAWSVDTSGSNSCVLKLNAVSSLTQTTLQVHYTVISTGPAIVTGG